MIGTVKMLPADPKADWRQPPPGFGPLVHTPQGLETLSKGLLSEPEGTRALFKADGFWYMARLEPHPPVPERGLPAWHKGVTVYEEHAHANPWQIPVFLAGMATLGYVLASLWR